VKNYLPAAGRKVKSELHTDTQNRESLIQRLLRPVLQGWLAAEVNFILYTFNVPQLIY